MAIYQGFVPRHWMLVDSATSMLRDALLPIHYVDLARACWIDIGWTGDEETLLKSAEDLRQIARDGKHGLGFVGLDGPPLVFLREWFDTQPRLFNVGSPCFLDLTKQILFAAGVEATARAPFMKAHLKSDPMWLGNRRMSGTSIEHRIVKFFIDYWPLLYVVKSNALNCKQPSADDFSLKLDGRMICIDVAGRNRDGLFKASASKLKADVHVCADVDVERWVVVMHGWCRSAAFKRGVTENELNPLQRLFVRLNCAQFGVDYRALKRAAELTWRARGGKTAVGGE